ncbi:MAG: putative hydrolase [Candidatus Xenolissoclinum pacificiensis L6]|uniref:Hydrolase n=1 Tax=Candidatus Xenolissoclinum pacificiensis L6 TaxID=1401685 RepID=W2UZ48_9RICK|nr:MAG: putative hydrolase [Candidatus Xenolissoclinum pacificiensis L6]
MLKNIVIFMTIIVATWIGHKYTVYMYTQRPVMTVAGLVYVIPEKRFVLIERNKPPTGLAMFGGHVEAKESPEEALNREAMEELHIQLLDIQLIELHGRYGRDPRQHSIEGTYFATTYDIPYPGSDAKIVKMYTFEELENVLEQDIKFAFDHMVILQSLVNDIHACGLINCSWKSDFLTLR